MTGWTFFFLLIGVAAVTWQLFRLIDLDRAALPPLSPAPCRPVMDHGRSGETDHPHGRSQIRRGLHLQRR